MNISRGGFRIFLVTFAVALAFVRVASYLGISTDEIYVDLPKTVSPSPIIVRPETDMFYPIGGGGGSGCEECGGGYSGGKEIDPDNTPLTILSKPRAQYTDAARAENVEGSVVLRVAFLKNGTIGSTTVIRGLGYGLNDQAIRAAREIVFQPKTVDRHPVTTTRTVEYNFRIY